MKERPMPIDLTCETCGAAFQRAPSQIKKRAFCSKRCAYDAMLKPEPKSRRMLVRPNHPLAGKGRLISEARAVLYAKIGPGPHDCHWCGSRVEWRPGEGVRAKGVLMADHINNDRHDNRPENLVPACQACNGGRNSPIKVLEGEAHTLRADGYKLRFVIISCATCDEPFQVPYHTAWNVKRRGTKQYCSARCRYGVS
jgi:hypothetical protein